MTVPAIHAAAAAGQLIQAEIEAQRRREILAAVGWTLVALAALYLAFRRK